MLNLSPELANKIQGIGNELKKYYGSSTNQKEIIRQSLRDEQAVFRQMQLYTGESLSNWLKGREVAAVDGSVNQTKGQPPHLLYLFQALAKTTTGHECRAADVFAPLLVEKDEETNTKVNWRSHLLAKLELEVASQLLAERDVGVLLMDGALYHYRIDAPEEWEKLRQRALDCHTLLVGVSEEITTENLVKLEAFSREREKPHAFDRDLLFGVLNRGETLYLESIQQKAGLESVWMRPSTSPAITGFDILKEQGEHKELISDLLFSLTPKEGRGIPLWLDYIDRDVRVTDKLVEALVEQYVDREIKERLFVQKRQGRPY